MLAVLALNLWLVFMSSSSLLQGYFFCSDSFTSVLCTSFSLYFHPEQHDGVVRCKYEFQQCSLWYRCLLIDKHSCRMKTVSKKCWEIVLTRSVFVEHPGVVVWIMCLCIACCCTFGIHYWLWVLYPIQAE